MLHLFIIVTVYRRLFINVYIFLRVKSFLIEIASLLHGRIILYKVITYIRPCNVFKVLYFKYNIILLLYVKFGLINSLNSYPTFIFYE